LNESSAFRECSPGLPPYLETRKTGDRRLKVLFIALWYPYDDNPSCGVFTKEHARAAARNNEVRVLHVIEGKPSCLLPRRQESGADDGAYDVTRVYRHRFAPIALLERKADDVAIQMKRSTRFYKRLSGCAMAGLAKIIRASRSPGYSVSVMRAFRKLRAEGWTPDIIHAHVYAAGFPAVIIGRLYGIPVVVSEHFSLLARGELNVLERLKARFVARRADALLPVSPLLAEALVRYGARGNISVVPNIVDTSLFHFSERPVSAERPRMLAVLSSNPGKGFDCLIDAAAILFERRPGAFLKILGVDREKYETNPRALCLINKGALEIRARQDKEYVARSMIECDFLVHPTLFETFGIVAFEAMACGKPVVASKIRAFEETMPAMGGILFPPGDSGALAEAVEYMIDHLGEYGGEELASFIEREFGWLRITQMLDGVYRSLA